jgi:hypothetical protein
MATPTSEEMRRAVEGAKETRAKLAKALLDCEEHLEAIIVLRTHNDQLTAANAAADQALTARDKSIQDLAARVTTLHTEIRGLQGSFIAMVS